MMFCEQYLAVGPPVYFVLNNTATSLDLSQLENQNKICGSQGCNIDSLQVSGKIRFLLFNSRRLFNMNRMSRMGVREDVFDFAPY